MKITMPIVNIRVSIASQRAGFCLRVYHVRNRASKRLTKREQYRREIRNWRYQGIIYRRDLADMLEALGPIE